MNFGGKCRFTLSLGPERDSLLTYQRRMNSDEYDNLVRVERHHWFYTGKRTIARWAIDTFGSKADRPTLFDCGAGTGAFAAEMVSTHHVSVMDDHAESLELLRQKFTPDQVIEGSASAMPLPDNTADIVTLLDVLEHVEDDTSAVAEIHRVLKPGGILVLTVPAMMQLWSSWDEVLHHFRRYHREPLRAMFSSADWQIEHIKYVNTAVFPLVWWARRSRRPTDSARSEEYIPPGWINACLRWVFVKSAVTRWWPAPFGVGLLLVVRRK